MKQLLYKLLGKKYTWLAVNYRQIRTYSYSLIFPYRYKKGRYDGTFLLNEPAYEFDTSFSKPVDRVIYVFWVGDDDIPPVRMNGINSLRENSGIDVKIITLDNLDEYIVPNDPLPEEFDHLCFVHRADYLRTYFMYHHGGGYADIKPSTGSWINAFDRLDSSDAFAIGYPEVGFEGVANTNIKNANLKRDTHIYWRYMIGNENYIFRPHTRFAAEWLTECKRRVKSFSEELKLHPAQDPRGQTGGYPVPWSYILGQIFHPLCLKYHDKLLKDKDLKPLFENYR